MSWESFPLRVSARSFLQVNRATAARIYSDVAAELAQLASQIPGRVRGAYSMCTAVWAGWGSPCYRAFPAASFSDWVEESAIADAKAAAERMNASAQTCFGRRR